MTTDKCESKPEKLFRKHMRTDYIIFYILFNLTNLDDARNRDEKLRSI